MNVLGCGFFGLGLFDQVVLALGAAQEVALDLGSLLEHVSMLTDRARLGHRFVPTGKVTFRVVGATIENPLGLSGFLDNFALAAIFRAFDAQSQGLGILTVGIGRTGHEPAEAP